MSEVCQYTGHEFDTVACAFLPLTSPEGHPLFITASKDSSIRVWNQTTGSCLIKHQDGTAGAFSGLAVLPAPAEGGGLVRVAATTITSGVYVFAIDLQLSKLVCLAMVEPVAGMT